MRKIFPVLIALLVAAVCFAAAAENAQNGLTWSLEDGNLVIRIALEAGDQGEWEAAAPEENGRVISLLSSDLTDSEAVFVYTPVENDGWEDIAVWHRVDSVCDKFFDLIVGVENGAVGGADVEFIAAPEEKLLDTYMVGEWLEAETQVHTMDIAENEASGWDLTVTAPMSHDVFQFTGTVHYDCDADALVYTNGTVFILPVTDGETAADAEPETEDMAGMMFFDVSNQADGELILIWENPITHDMVTFRRSDENAPDILVPEIVDVDTEDGILPDGTYWMNFRAENLKADRLEETIYCAVDIYSGTDIRQIAPGEMIFRDFMMFWIDRINEDGSVNYTNGVTGETGVIGFLSIPGSDDYAGMNMEDGNSLMLTYADTLGMPLSGSVKMLVISGAEMETAEVGAEALAETVDMVEGTVFAVVRDGSIAEIRYYKDVPDDEMLADIRGTRE